MILVDPNLGPDLDPAPARRSSAAKKSAAARRPTGWSSQPVSGANSLPSVRTLTLFLNQARAAVRLRGEISVLLTTDGAIRALNRDFRRKNKPTDVLSFPAEGGLPEEIAGDLAVSVDTARRQAAAFGHPLGKEIKILILHGLLHLAGYDHESDNGRMARRERQLRAQFNLPQGLIERATARDASRSRRP